jgi:hypothetical protein
MKNKIFFGIHLFLSLYLLIGWGNYVLNQFLKIGISKLIVYPFFLGLFLIPLSFSYQFKRAPALRYLPLGINLLTLLIGVGLLGVDSGGGSDVRFNWFYKDYSTAVALIESNQIAIKPNHFAPLPENLTHISLTGYVYVTQNENLTTIYFIDNVENLDGFSSGYLYRSDGNPPPTPDKPSQERCKKWRAINSSTPKWFYCIYDPNDWYPR